MAVYRRLGALIAVEAAAAFLLAGSPAPWAQDRPTQLAAVPGDGPITIGRAIVIAEQAAGGAATGAALDSTGGAMLFDVAVAKGGDVVTVTVDSRSGAVVAVSRGLSAVH